MIRAAVLVLALIAFPAITTAQTSKDFTLLKLHSLAQKIGDNNPFSEYNSEQMKKVRPIKIKGFDFVKLIQATDNDKREFWAYYDTLGRIAILHDSDSKRNVKSKYLYYFKYVDNLVFIQINTIQKITGRNYEAIISGCRLILDRGNEKLVYYDTLLQYPLNTTYSLVDKKLRPRVTIYRLENTVYAHTVISEDLKGKNTKILEYPFVKESLYSDSTLPDLYDLLESNSVEKSPLNTIQLD